ncbi:hypothetical protein LN470_11830, partial [Xanthomonas phaseoli]|nr:hypothetical protein [Xanthomonas phaseoli]
MRSVAIFIRKRAPEGSQVQLTARNANSVAGYGYGYGYGYGFFCFPYCPLFHFDWASQLLKS